MIREILMILFVTCSTLGGQLLIKHAVTQIAARPSPPTGLDWLAAAMFSPAILAAIAIQGLGFIVWVIVVSRMKLGVAFAISGGSFYLLVAAVTWLVYGERLTLLQWTGLLLISSGVVVSALSGQNH